MAECTEKKTVSDFMYKYGTITIYSEHGGMVCPWDRDLLKYYKNREVVFVWINPVDCHAYLQIR